MIDFIKKYGPVAIGGYLAGRTVEYGVKKVRKWRVTKKKEDTEKKGPGRPKKD